MAVKWCVSSEGPDWNFLHLFFVSLSFCSFSMSHLFAKVVHYSNMAATAYPLYYGILLLVCFPLIFIQIKMGAHLQKGLVGVFSASIPVFKGAGIAVIFTTFIRSLVEVYYTGLIGYYTIRSLEDPLPWHKDTVRNTTSTIDEAGTFLWWLPASNAVVWVIILVCTACGLRVLSWVLTFFGTVGITLSFALLAYGREEFIHSANPEKNFYKANWEESIQPNTFDALTTDWVPVINLTVVIVAVFFGAYPTIGKCAKKRPTTAWIPIFIVLAAMPHLFINLLAPFIDAAALKLGVTDAQLIIGSGMSHESLFLLLPRIASALEAKKGIAFIWFFVPFIFSLMGQILHSAVIVDNVLDWIKPSSLNCFKNEILLNIVIAFCYCAVCFGLSLPMLTEGGFYIVHLVSHWLQRGYGLVGFFVILGLIISYARHSIVSSCNRVVFVLWSSIGGLFACAMFIYFAKFDEEIKTFTLIAQDGLTNIDYPEWAYALGWLVCLGPTVFGLLIGVIHACCSSEQTLCGVREDGGSEVSSTQREKNRYFNDYRAPIMDDYLEPSRMRRF